MRSPLSLSALAAVASLCILVVVCGAGQLAAAQSANPPDVADASKKERAGAAEWVHEMGRARFDGTRVEKTVFLATFNDYSQALGVMATVAIVIGAVVGLCGCCALSVQIKVSNGEDKEYSEMERNINRVALCAFAVVAIVMMIIGLSMQAAIPGSMEFFSKQLNTEAEAFQAIVEALPNHLDNTYFGNASNNRFGRDFTSQFLMFTDGQNSLVSSMSPGTTDLAEKSEGDLVSVEQSRVAVLAVTYVIGLITCLIACAAGAFSSPMLSVSTSFCSFLSFALMWLLIASHFIITVFVSDVCYDIRKYEGGIAARLDNRSSLLLDEMAQFGGNTETVWDDYLIFHDFTLCPNFKLAVTCEGYIRTEIHEASQTAFNSTFNCTGNCNCTLASNSPPCACGNQSTTSACTQLRTDFLADWPNHMQYMRDCRWVERVLTNKLANSNDDCVTGEECGDLCEGASAGTVGVWITAFIASLLFCCLGEVGALGYKRLDREGGADFY